MKDAFATRSNISFSNVTLKDGFWKEKFDMVRNTTIHAVYDRFKETGRVDAFRCLYKPGDEIVPHVFWDSDVAKWIESAAYLIEKEPEPELEAKIDEIVSAIEENQREDGYFNSHFLTVEPENIFQNRNAHELYCAGHLLEAAIAYKRATGKDTFYNCMKKYIDYIDKVFRVEQSAAFRTPGHEEIELALLKLYNESGEEKYLDLSLFFLDERGSEKEAHLFPTPASAGYSQSRLPVREMREAEGHAVRLTYLYIAAAEAAYLKKDALLAEACEAMFKNIVFKKMYVTGGIGSCPNGEAFEHDYYLPNDLAYCETCASIGLALFAHRMQLLSDSSLYPDIIERTIYNGILSGVSGTGDHFFYKNPLEHSEDKHKSLAGIKYPRSTRVKVFSCSCCPPNVTRFFPSLGNFLYTETENAIRVNQYTASEAKIGALTLTQKTRYPRGGKIEVTVTGGDTTLALRIPSWCFDYELPEGAETKNGFAYVKVKDGETVSATFHRRFRLVAADPRVAENAGKVAVTFGPFVYCAEAIDNETALYPGAKLDDIRIAYETIPHIKKNPDFENLPVIDLIAFRREIPYDEETPLYRTATPALEPVPLRLIPYALHANRGNTDLRVWFLSTIFPSSSIKATDEF